MFRLFIASNRDCKGNKKTFCVLKVFKKIFPQSLFFDGKHILTKLGSACTRHFPAGIVCRNKMMRSECKGRCVRLDVHLYFREFVEVALPV